MSLANRQRGKSGNQRRRWAAKTKPRNRRLRLEPLEERRLLALLGIELEEPVVITWNPFDPGSESGAISYTYDYTDEDNFDVWTFDLDATPVSIGPPPVFFTGTGSFDINIQIKADDDGNVVSVTGVEGPDLLLTGDVDGFSGELLTGEIVAFGFFDSPNTTIDQFDFRFEATGGALKAVYFPGKDIGVTVDSENSTFAGDFGLPFVGEAKGNIGPTEPGAEPGIDIEKFVKSVERGGGEGLTPGYWKQPHHFDSWTDFEPNDNYNDVFGLDDTDDDPSLTLLGALERGGGENNALGRHAVAAILNAANTYIDYDLTFSQIQAAVQDAYATGIFEPLKDQLDDYNNQGADLSTPAGTGTPGPWLDADSPTGPLVEVGGEVEFLYVVTNPGTEPLSNVIVVDDNETPGDTEDDFSPEAVVDEFFKNVGDTDKDDLLDPLEEWEFKAMKVVTEGQHVNTGTATGQLPGGSEVTDEDVAHWFGTTDMEDLAIIEGMVWLDLDDDGVVDCNEPGIAGVTVQLTGTNDHGELVNLVAVTDSDGTYIFVGLRPSDANGYMIVETQPDGYNDGQDIVGEVNGTTVGFVDGNDKFSGVVLQAGEDGINYNFGELPVSPTGEFLTGGQTATIGFWQNKNGQKLIKSLNGGASDTQLSTWLATEFPNLYGADSGDNDLTGMTNAEVADHFRTIFKTKKAKKSSGPTKLDPQIMAVALAIYVTDTDLAVGTVAQNYGFTTSQDGTGAALFDIDQHVGSGTAETLFGTGTSSVMTVMEILKRTDEASLDGVVFADGDNLGFASISTLESLQRTLLNELMTAINEEGDI